MNQTETDKYLIYDTMMKNFTSKEYKTRRSAQRIADKLDLEYGAYRYFVVASAKNFEERA